jgi:hypothetical protein
VGAASIRRAGESWEGLDRRLSTMHPADFGPDAKVIDTTLASLGFRSVEELLQAARR